MDIKRVALRIMFFSFFGILIEVTFTALAGLVIDGDHNLRGHSSLWMLPVYGLLGIFILPVSEPLKQRGISLPFRAIIYMVLIFLVEYIFGVIFRGLGLDIWNYSHLPLNIHGHITLTYAPFWYWLGLWLEFLHRKIDTFAVVLLCGIQAEQVVEL